MHPRPSRDETASGVRLLATMARSSGEATGEVTDLLDAWRRGEEQALVRLMEVVQGELHQIARRLFRGERRDHTLQPTAVVNELYLRLARQHHIGVRNRSELLAVAAHMMRRVLVDHARRRGRQKRGGGVIHLELDEGLGLPSGPGAAGPDVLALDDALIDLERRSPRQSRIVELRLLVGLELEEIATVEGISRSTVSREWKAARLFLLRQLDGAGSA